MNFIHKFLINVICFVKGLFRRPDYTIVSRVLEYWVDNNVDFETSDEFWENQSAEWDEITETYYVNLSENEVIPEPPKAVKKTMFRIKYVYNNQMYKYITYNRNYEWPPNKCDDIRFSIPISTVYLLDKNCKPVRDLYKKIQRYTGGPHKYCENIKIADMLYYSEDALKNCFPKILIKNIFGVSKIVSTVDGYISDLRAL